MEWAARAIGIFYLIGGLVVIHRARVNWLLDDAVARISLSKTPVVERTVGVAMFVIAGLTAISGLMLALWHSWCWLPFIVCWFAQSLYLLWAQRWYAPDDEIDLAGRRRSINALAVFSVATAGVLWLALEGRLG